MDIEKDTTSMRKNAGYTITESICVGNVEFVLGENTAAPARFVTWECKDGDNYYWGHYMTDKLAALRDLLDRAGQDLTILESRQTQRTGKNDRRYMKDEAGNQAHDKGGTEIQLYAEPADCRPDRVHRSSAGGYGYGTLLDTGKIVIYKRGETGYYKTDIPYTGKEEARSLVDEYNTKAGVTKAQEAAMAAGSMFGFDVPAADPANYDENGQPIKPKNRNRDYER